MSVAQYAAWSTLYRRKEGIVFLLKSTSRQFGNIPCVLEALGPTEESRIVDDSSFSPAAVRRLARARVLVQDQSSRLLSGLSKDTATIGVQIWHSGGWYKKVAYDAPRPGYPRASEMRRIGRIHRNIDYMVICDAKLVPLYSAAFHLPEDHVLPLGLPRTDRLLCRDRAKDLASLYAAYPQLEGKRLFLYAPTWRADWKQRRRLQPQGPDVAAMREMTDASWAFLWRTHPSLADCPAPRGWLNISNLEQDFCLSVADALGTDYSSILFDFALLNRPIYLFTPDRDTYVGRERGLYLEPEELAPGAVALSSRQLAELLVSGGNVSPDLRKCYMSACDGQSSLRVAKFLRELES